MAFSKYLILKGIIGLAVTTVGGVAIGGIIYNKKIFSFYGKTDQLDSDSDDEATTQIESQTPDGTEGNSVNTSDDKSSTRTDGASTPVASMSEGTKKTEDDLGIPNDCTSSCQLTQEQLGKIKFEPKNGSSITVSGLETNDKVTLTITNVSGDTTNYPKGKNYNFKAPAGKTVTIAGAKDGDVSITNEGVDFKGKKDENLLERIPKAKKPEEAVEDDQGIPKSCGASQIQSGVEKTCELNEEQLKKIKFKALDGASTDSEVTVTGLNGNIKLKITHENDTKNYPQNKKYTFENSSNSNEVKITKGDKSLSIAKNTDSYFKVADGKLVLVKTKLKEEKETKMKNINGELNKAGITFVTLVDSDFNQEDKVEFKKKETSAGEDSLKKIKFKEFDGESASTISWPIKAIPKNIKIELFYESDAKKFPNNVKVVLTNSTNGDVKFEKSSSNKNFSIFSSNSGSNTITFKVADGKLEKETTDSK